MARRRKVVRARPIPPAGAVREKIGRDATPPESALRVRGLEMRPAPGTRSRAEERRQAEERAGMGMARGGRVPPVRPPPNSMTMVDGKFRPNTPPTTPRRRPRGK